jgi:hypothetical protein
MSAAEVRRLEESWTTAFNARNTSFMEQVMAPEFALLSSGRTPGAKRVPYEAKIIDVVVAGNTAVATLEARWTRDSYLTDTWARRNGRWQLMFRHSVPRS